jgi:hypothetical protein
MDCDFSIQRAADTRSNVTIFITFHRSRCGHGGDVSYLVGGPSRVQW